MERDSGLTSTRQGAARWSLRLLGGFELQTSAGGEAVTLPGKRERVLLAALALSQKGRHERRKLVTLLWGDDADAGTLDNLRTCVWTLRKALGDTEHRLISSEGRDIVLDPERLQVDVLEFRRLGAQADVGDLEAAAALYAGDFLDGLSIESDEFEVLAPGGGDALQKPGHRCSYSAGDVPLGQGPNRSGDRCRYSHLAHRAAP